MSHVTTVEEDDINPPPEPPIGQFPNVDHFVRGNLRISDGLNVGGMDIGPGNVRSNTPMGLKTLKLNTTGYNNTSMGFKSMLSNTEGDGNCVVGYRGLYANTTGSGNVAVGAKALYSMGTGDKNVAVGCFAGQTVDGSNNTNVGADAQGAPGLNYAASFGAGASVTTSNTLVLGRAESDKIVIGATGDDGSGDKLQVTGGSVGVKTVGQGLKVKEGTNAKQGVVTLITSSVTVANTSVTANSRILLTHQSVNGSPGVLTVVSRNPGASFTIQSYPYGGGDDNSIVAYQIFEPA